MNAHDMTSSISDSCCALDRSSPKSFSLDHIAIFKAMCLRYSDHVMFA